MASAVELHYKSGQWTRKFQEQSEISEFVKWVFRTVSVAVRIKIQIDLRQSVELRTAADGEIWYEKQVLYTNEDMNQKIVLNRQYITQPNN